MRAAVNDVIGAGLVGRSGFDAEVDAQLAAFSESMGGGRRSWEQVACRRS